MMDTIARRERTRYQDSGVRIGSSSVVHDTAEVHWMLGLTLPAPACHSGFGVDLTRMSPVKGEVTCRNCRKTRGGGKPPAMSGQLPLF